MSRLRFSGRRVLRWFIFIVALLIVLNMVVMPLVVAIYAASGHPKSPGEMPDGYEAVTFMTEDGVELAAWYTPPADDNGAVIVLVHGAGNSKGRVIGHAAMLTAHGFGVLAFDLRGHGDSGGQLNRFGWNGGKDVSAAVNFLQARDEVKAIGGLGLSLGGEVLLGAANENPAMTAIVADGATSRCHDEAIGHAAGERFPATVYYRVQDFFVWVFTGDTPPTPILNAMGAVDTTRYLFIAAGNESREIDYNTVFAERVGESRAEVWVAEDVGHIAAFDRYPDEYERRVVAFFESALVNPAQDE